MLLSSHDRYMTSRGKQTLTDIDRFAKLLQDQTQYSLGPRHKLWHLSLEIRVESDQIIQPARAHADSGFPC